MNSKTSELSQAVRITLALGLLFIGLCTRGASGAQAQPRHETFAQPYNVTSNWMIPFRGAVFVNTSERSEWVDLADSIHLVVKVSLPTDPCASCVPPNPTRIHTNLVSINGVGRTSGARYEATGAANFELDVDVPGAFSVQASYRLQSIPASASASPSRLPVRYSISLNADREVTNATAAVGGSDDAPSN